MGLTPVPPEYLPLQKLLWRTEFARLHVHFLRGILHHQHSILHHQHHGSMRRIMHYVYGRALCAFGCNAPQLDEDLLLQSDLSTPAHTCNGSRFEQVISSPSSFGSILMQYYNAHRRMLNYSHHRHHHPHQCHAYTISIRQCRSLCTIDSKDKAGTSDGNSAHEEAAWKTLAMQMQSLGDEFAKGEALNALKALVDDLEPFADPGDLRFGAACLRLARSLRLANEKPAKYLCYGQRALRSYESLKGSVEHAECLRFLGFAYIDMKEFQSAVAHLEHCVSVLQQIKGSMRNDACNQLELLVHQALGQAKAHLQNFRGSLMHYEHLIRIGEKSMKLGNRTLATYYAEAGIVTRKAKDLNGAMHLSLKAFNAYMTCYGPSSLQVAHARASLVGIYSDLGKYEDAMSEFEEARPILEYLGDTELVAAMNHDLANLLVHQKRYAAAMPRLEEVIKSTQVTSVFHVRALIDAAKTSLKLYREDIAADYMKKALDALDHQGYSIATAKNLASLGFQYKKEYLWEQAAVLFQKALKVLEECGNPPQYRHLVVLLEGRVGELLVKIGKLKEAIPYLESCLSKRESLNGIQRLSAHMFLGIAYSQDTQMRGEALKQFNACDSLVTEWWKTWLAVAICKNHDHIFGIMGAFEHLCICILCLVTRTT